MQNQASTPQKSQEVRKRQKSQQGKSSQPDSKSSRSNSVHSSSSRHHKIEQDIQAKLHEAPQPLAPSKSTLQMYLQRQLQYFSEYIGLDLMKDFVYAQYIHWRSKAQKFNEFHNQLERADIVVVEKYVMDGLAKSSTQVPDFSQNQYLQFRQQWLPYFEYLAEYILNCAHNHSDVSYIGYEYFAEFMRQRDLEVGHFRKQVIESNKVSYSEAVFDEFITNPNCKYTIEAYDAFFKQVENREQNQIVKYKEDVAQLKKSIQNLNLYVFNDYIEACTEHEVEPTLEGYKVHEEQLRKEFNDDYLQEKHLEIESDIAALGQGPRQIITGIDADELQFLNVQSDSLLQGGGQPTAVDDQPLTEHQMQKRIIQSEVCDCCKGKPQDCSGQACALLGLCICQTNY